MKANFTELTMNFHSVNNHKPCFLHPPSCLENEMVLVTKERREKILMDLCKFIYQFCSIQEYKHLAKKQ